MISSLKHSTKSFSTGTVRTVSVLGTLSDFQWKNWSLRKFCALCPFCTFGQIESFRVGFFFFWRPKKRPKQFQCLAIFLAVCVSIVSVYGRTFVHLFGHSPSRESMMFMLFCLHHFCLVLTCPVLSRAVSLIFASDVCVMLIFIEHFNSHMLKPRYGRWYDIQNECKKRRNWESSAMLKKHSLWQFPRHWLHP